MKNEFRLDHDGKKAALKYLESLPDDGSKVMVIRNWETHRSLLSNRLQQQWHNEAGEQDKSKTAEEHRAYCKLHFGVPIMRAGSDEYREAYDQIIRPLNYEQKLYLMQAPLDYPVTRGMSSKQHTNFMDQIYQYYRGLWIKLTEPRR